MFEEKPRNKKLESLDDQEESNFRNFIKENENTADQIREAYYRLVGVNEEVEPTSEVAAILGKMREMVERSFPLNRFAVLIESKQNYENAVPMYHEYIDGLRISENEKRVLGSIIDKGRSGEFTCLVDGEIVGEFEINVKDLGKAVAAVIIVQNIKKILENIPTGRKYEFTFSEQ